MSREEVYISTSENGGQNSNVLPGISQISDSNFQMSLRSSGFYQSVQQSDLVDQESDGDNKSDVIFCVLWKAGKLGGAYYNSADSELNIINDTLDMSPDFIMAKTLFNQIQPTHTITIGTLASQFVSILSNFVLNIIEDSSTSASSEKTLPPNIQLLKHDEYSFELCKHAVENLKLPSEPEGVTESERIMYICSLVNFNHRLSLHALGALVLFLNKYRGVIQPDMSNKLFLGIHTVSIQDQVLMDEDTFSTLHIFNSNTHQSYFRGKERSNEEGLNVYKLFDTCRSSLGRIALRSLLLQPTNNILILKKRQEFIEFSLKPINNGLINGLKDCLRHIYPISAILTKIHGNQAVLKSWSTLYSTLHNMLLIYQMVEAYISEVELFREFDSEITVIISAIMKTIGDTIDFDNSAKTNVAIKIGVDEELDTKKRYRSEIGDKINLAASYEIHNLPSYIKDCSIVYIPQIGYLVAVNKWDENADYKDIEKLGFRHMFTLGDMFNFKSAVCDELDKCLGDIYTEIQEHEARIMLRLSQHVLANSVALKKPLKMVALFDCLISMAEVAKELGYTQPNLVLNNVLSIEEGKHPLLDLCVPNFVPNSLESGGTNSLVKLITGPNNSGKSIYLKQTALIVYLAHIGSYVPAKSATIGMFASIHCCTSSNITESITVKMSTFAVDLRLISQALNCSKPNSLILIDEFGRSTTELDGLALLTSYLEHFLIREEYCPHILVSTHYLHVTNLIEESKLVEHFKCDHKLNDNKLIFLYNIVKGISKSYAKYAALSAGISEDIVKRSEEILRCYHTGAPLKPWSEKQ